MATIDFGTWGKSAFTRDRWVNRPTGHGDYFFAGRDASIRKEQKGSYVVYFGTHPMGSRSTLPAAKNLAVDKVDELRRASREAQARAARPAAEYVVTITNGSGIKTAAILSKGFSVAWSWARGFASYTQQQTGERWDVMSVNAQ